MITVYVIRAFGGVLILTVTPAPPVTATIIATGYSRDGKTTGISRDGITTGKGRS